jgi:hypothetical protein
MSKAFSPDAPTFIALKIDGPVQARQGLLDVLWLGSLRLDHVTVQIPNLKDCAAPDGAAPDGLLGLDVLSVYLTVIDGPGRFLYLARRPSEKGSRATP